MEHHQPSYTLLTKGWMWLNMHVWNLLAGLECAIVHVSQLSKECFLCHPCADDDDGNNYLIAVTNVRIELNRIDFCVDSCGASLCLYANENKYWERERENETKQTTISPLQIQAVYIFTCNNLFRPTFSHRWNEIFQFSGRHRHTHSHSQSFSLFGRVDFIVLLTITIKYLSVFGSCIGNITIDVLHRAIIHHHIEWIDFVDTKSE